MTTNYTQRKKHNKKSLFWNTEEDFLSDWQHSKPLGQQLQSASRPGPSGPSTSQIIFEGPRHTTRSFLSKPH